MYRTVRYEINTKHPMYEYCMAVCSRFKNMYNVANYYIRNVMTGIKKPEGEITPNEAEVLETVRHYLEINNASFNKKTGKPKKQFVLPTAENWFLGYEPLNAIFSFADNADYRSLHSNIAQNAIRKCVATWHSFFAAKQEYSRHPDKFKGKCKIPKYLKAEMTTAWLTNRCFSVKKNKRGRYLAFAKLKDEDSGKKTGARFYIGDYIDTDKLEKIEIKPYYGNFLLLITYEDAMFCEVSEDTGTEVSGEGKVMGVDLGMKNFAAITDNLGSIPVIIKGGFLKSRNQYFNKYKALITSRLQKGRKKHVSSKRIEALSAGRDRFFRDCFYKMAHKICRLATERGITKIVVGHTDFWKTGTDMGHQNNQGFVSIPFGRFIRILETTACRYGISVVEQEESYTSKASFLDNDGIPVYGKAEKPVFSGSRVTRGMYRSGDGRMINADINASLNIIRKSCGDSVFDGTDRNLYRKNAAVWNYYDFYPLKKKLK